MQIMTESSFMEKKEKVTLIKISSIKKMTMNTNANSIKIIGVDDKLLKAVTTVEVKTKTCEGAVEVAEVTINIKVLIIINSSLEVAVVQVLTKGKQR